MKKLLVIFLICVSFIFAGCSTTGGMMLIKESDGSYIERYYVPFPKDEIYRIDRAVSGDIFANIHLNTLLTNVKEFCDTNIFSALLDKFKQKVELSSSLSSSQKVYLINGVVCNSNLNSLNINEIIYEFKFIDNTCYNKFKELVNETREEISVTETKSFFTTTKKVENKTLFNNIIDGKTITNKMIEVVESQMQIVYDDLWDVLKTEQNLNFENLKNTVSYTLVVPTARYHSNADRVWKSENYYYHTWDISLDEDNISLEYWTVTPNTWSWYVISLIGGLLTLIVVLVVAKIKEKHQPNKTDGQGDVFNIEQ